MHNNSQTLCNCGSGKFEHHCCAIEGYASEYEDLDAYLNARSHTSMDDLQRSADEFMKGKNNVPLQEFCGFSASQMGYLLYEPFTSDSTIVFNESISPPMNSLVMIALTELIEGIPADGLKATTKGNLPMAICRPAAAKLFEHAPERGRYRYEKFRTEEDLMPLLLVRLLLGLGGYLKKTKGRFNWTKKGRDFIKCSTGHCYLELLKLAATRFNWGYFDGYPDVPIIQLGFAYTLFLVQSYGDHPKPESFYTQLFLEAFPMGLMEMDGSDLHEADSRFESCYTVRSFDRFMEYFGLIESQLIPAEMGKTVALRKTSHLDGLVAFF